MKFTFATAEEGFDDHIENSVRGYSNLWNDILKLSLYFLENDTNMVDIGCSTGKLIEQMQEQNKESIPKAKYIGIELEEDFFANYKLNDSLNIEYIKEDIRNYKFENCSLVTSIFTLQFMPHKDRKKVIKNIYKGLNQGGGLIFSEKIISNQPQIQEMLTFIYYDYKKKYFSESEILEKEVLLRSMMKPSTLNEIISMCEDVGFTCVQQFWQNFNFLAFIAIKR